MTLGTARGSHRRAVCLGATLLLYLWLSSVHAQNNSWISSSAGKWETNSNWSLGVAPTNGHSVFVTNAFSKTVTIDSITAGTTTMTVSNLTVSAPTVPASANMLSLNNSGSLTPLRVLNNLVISTNATLTVFSASKVQLVNLTGIGSLVVNGGGFVNLIDGGELVATNGGAAIAGTGTGSVSIRNATLRTRNLNIGLASGAMGTLTLESGLAEMQADWSIGTVAGSHGAVWMTNGQLTAGAFMHVGLAGSGQMAVSNGVVTSSALFVGKANGGAGTLTIAGGAVNSGTSEFVHTGLTVGDDAVGTGTVWITGGTLNVTNPPFGGAASVIIGRLGRGSVTLSNGTFRADRLVVAPNASATGALTVAGGTLIADRLIATNAGATIQFTGGTMTLRGAEIDNGQSFTVAGAGRMAALNVIGGTNNFQGGLDVSPVASSTGVVWLTGGQLVATNTGSLFGQLVISNGTFLAGDVFLGNTRLGTITVAGGTLQMANAFNGLIVGANAGTGALWQTGGQIVTTNTDISIGGLFSPAVGQMTVSNGTLLAGDVFVGGQGDGRGTFTIAGGVARVSGSLTAGSSSGATGVVWVTGGQLAVTNTPTTIGEAGVGQMIVSNGTVLSSNVFVAANAGSQGTVTIAGGSNTFLGVLRLGGQAGVTGTVWLTGGELSVSNVTDLGLSGVGRMTVSNGTWRAAREINLGRISGSRGELTLAGGTNILNLGLRLGEAPTATGVVWMTGGQLSAPLSSSIIGDVGIGQMTVSNGTWTGGAAVGFVAGSKGTLTIAGGNVFLPGLLLGFEGTGTVWVTGGQLHLTNAAAQVGFNGVGQLTVSNGVVIAATLTVAQNAGSAGTLTVAGGTLMAEQLVATNSGARIAFPAGTMTLSGARIHGPGSPAFSMGGTNRTAVLHLVSGTSVFVTEVHVGASPGSTGVIWQTGGLMDATGDGIFLGTRGNGQMTVSNGTCRSLGTVVGFAGSSGGSLTVAGGDFHSYFGLTMGDFPCAPTGSVTVTGGSLFVTNAAANATLDVRTGTLTISGGLLRADRIVLTNACARFLRTGGTLIYGAAVLNPADDTDGDGFSNQDELNAGSDPLDPTSVPASGQLGVTPATLNFGAIATGTTAQASFVVTNTGAGVLNGTATVTGGPFSILSGSPFSLAANKSTNVVVQFAPVAAGNFTNAVVFNAGAGGLSTNTVTGTGAIAPVANFTATPTNGVVPLTVTFTNTSTGTITNNLWNFGDTVTSNTTATVLTHTYNAAGSFTVTLIAQGPVGVSTNSKPNLIRALNPPQLNVTPASRDFGAVTVGQTNTLPFSVINTGDLALTGTVATASPFAIAGASSFNVAPASTGTVQVSFIPTGSGVFSNHVVFSSNGGASTNAVTGTGVAPGNINVNPALLDFGTIATGTTSQRVFVVSNSGGTIISNGTATVGAPFAIVAGQQFSVPAFGSTNVTVQFAPVSAGAFTSQVVFATANGGSSTNAVTGNAATVPVAAFSANPTNGAAPLLVFFTDESTGTITNRLWTFGDGATSGGTMPMHTYTTAGVFSVSLMVSGPTGSDTLNRPDLITVTNVAPMAGFTASPTNGTAPLLVNFTDASTGTITNRLWNFGDGATSTDTNPSHTYTNAGSFTVSLTVSGPTGSNTLTRSNLIVVGPAAPSADLELIKLGSDNFVLVGSNLTYTLIVTNRGPDTASSVTVTDALPASVTFMSASDDCTNVAGVVVCDLGTLTSGQTTNSTIVVTATVEGLLTNIATVAAAEADPDLTNNTDTVVTAAFTVPPPPHDLAVVKLKAPKRIALSATQPSKVGRFKVTIQNLGPHTETIPNLAALTALVTVEVESLGTNCASFAATLVPPAKPFPISIAPNKKLNLSYQATFNCANDPAATTRTEAHNDYRTTAMVDLGALGVTDTGASNDICPRPPSGADPGCGNKTSSGALGADVLTDVTVK